MRFNDFNDLTIYGDILFRVFFGQNMVCCGEEGNAFVRVGDRVVVLKMLSSVADAAA
ncbi:hypothetical protein M569_05987 [Genlisea aurea]|uniref:Uncharacterized protein n=1 Tax=Genlisea aurea TaxID=192259 RepID=S8CV58_9LAMI|nr:hypothetical protein M569_05987 [Genlisea aurea]